MKFSVSKQFRFDLIECIPHYFQVTTKCEQPPLDINDCHKNGQCPTQTIITILACDVEEVCRKVKQKLPGSKIEKIVKFTKPAMNRDQIGNQDPACNVDVTPIPGSCIDCCDLITESSSESSSESSAFLSSYIADISLIGPKPTNFIRSIPTTFNLPDSQIFGISNGIVTNNFVYQGSGIIDFTNSAIVDSNDAGELVQKIKFVGTIIDEAIVNIYLPVVTIPLPQTIQIVKIPCCDALFTLVLELRHTLDRINSFSSFLKANNIILPGVIKIGSTDTDFIKLSYFIRDDQWRGNLHFLGQSPSGSFSESWDIGITFGCLSSFWQFTMTLANTQPNKRSVSRLIAYFSKSDVCLGNRFFGFSFTIDTNLLQSAPVASQPLVLNDDAGIFRNLQMSFRILAQNQGVGSNQIEADNTVAYNATLS